MTGVIQQLQMGVAVSSVEKFLNRRAIQKSDTSQVKAEKVVKNYRNASSDKARKDALKVEQPVLMNAGGVGTVVGPTLDVKDTVTYEYCSSSTGICRPSGTVDVEFRMTIVDNMEFALSGDINVTSGSPILISTLYCYTYHDGLFNIDESVHNWQNCANARTYTEVMYRQIQGENWSGGTLGETYHPTYVLAFKNFATTFQKVWDGREYKVASNGSTSWT
ncbi:hypothetical protein [Pseudarthrobacter sp. LMD1-1-1.1]|uniref:hypothetical protein n=1 Tax=Pseudarthrobacter sp. LMD1-1-1.1 TaxID=3135242 RepID=UPI00344A57BF